MLDTRGMTDREAREYCQTCIGYGLPCPDPYDIESYFECGTSECIMCCAAYQQGRDTTPTLHAAMLSALYDARDELECWLRAFPDDSGTNATLREVNAAIDAAESEDNR